VPNVPDAVTTSSPGMPFLSAENTLATPLMPAQLKKSLMPITQAQDNRYTVACDSENIEDKDNRDQMSNHDSLLPVMDFEIPGSCDCHNCDDTLEEALPKFHGDGRDAESEEDSDWSQEDSDLDADTNGMKTHDDGCRFELRKPPSIEDACCALQDLRSLLKPAHNEKHHLKLDPVLKERLTQMKNFLWLYTDVGSNGEAHAANTVGGQWGKAADQAARNAGKKQGVYLSRCLRNWSKAYINNRVALPLHKPSKKYSCVEDEDLAADLKLHLQSIRKFARAQDLVDYLSIPANQATHGFKKTISLKTAQRWMMKLGYHWKKEPTGQYSDGYERDDVVYYRQNVFLPAWNECQSRMRQWDRDTLNDPSVLEGDEEIGRQLVVWFHDESTFYANDCRKQCWVHMSEGVVPQPKGEGASLMVADFVSADYGWLRSPDGKESARILFRAGKARDGYFTNENIVAHAEKAMDILQKYYPHEDHALIFDNATTHLKRADDALSAHKLPKSPLKSWGITVTKKDSSGKAVLGADGKLLKEKIQMANGELPNGDPQPLYFPEGHVKAG